MFSDNIQDLKDSRIWKETFAELIGSFLWAILLRGYGYSYASDSSLSNNERLLIYSFGTGLSLSTFIWGMAHRGGGHFNPAISFAFMITRKITFIKCFLNIVFQLVGVILGSIVAENLTPESLRSSNPVIHLPKISYNFSNFSNSTQFQEVEDFPKVFVAELIGTFLFLMVVFASCDGKKEPNNSSYLIISLSLIALCIIFSGVSGCGLNPAMTLGNHIAHKSFYKYNFLWVYWVVPLIGGSLAGLVYEFLFASNASFRKFKNFFSYDYDQDYLE